MTATAPRQLTDLTATDMVSCTPTRVPRNAWRGEMQDQNGNPMGFVYVIGGAVVIGDVKPYGGAEIVKRLQGEFRGSHLERCGSLAVSSSQRVFFYRFRKEA